MTKVLACFVQGVGEFFPISSSAHLMLCSLFFGSLSDTPDGEVALHLGTLLSVVVVFRTDLIQMLQAVLGIKKNSLALRRAFSLIIATFPTIFIGYGVKRMGGVFSTLPLIAGTSIVFGFALYGSDRFSRYNYTSVSFTQAAWIGLAQSLAFIPGASRLGTCITAARLLGVQREEAMRFSFLLSIPTVLGAVTLTTYESIQEGRAPDIFELFPLIALTFLIGIVAIKGALWYLRRHSFSLFAIYRISLGIFLYLVYFRVEFCVP